ncbi:MAG: glycosyl transferase family 2 [Sphingobacteriales bacterium]|nr:glycosyl transferase family 2 [Sphingobacteriales bacterium]
MAKISVVIPTFNRPELLKRCLNALLKQTFEKSDYELIVVSDGVDEETDKVISQSSVYKKQITFISLPQKKGPAAARNLGWLTAKGILVAFTDDDTIPDKNWLSDIWHSYQGEEEIAYSGKVRVPLPSAPTDYELNTANLETAEFITANCVCTKQALIKAGGFDERFASAWREDSDLQFKLLLHNISIKKIEALVIHPVRQAPWGVSIKEQKKGMFNALLYKKYPYLYTQKINSKAPWNYYVSIFSFFGMLAGLITNSIIVAAVCSICWILLLGLFALKRLSITSHSVNHVVEMIVTSAAIPFLSVYWQFYGALKYRVLFI